MASDHSLDTDHFNVLQIGKGTSYDTFAAHMDDSSDQHFATTVVTFEEHMRGWLAGIRRARNVVDQVRPYDQLINWSGSSKRGRYSVSTKIQPRDFESFVDNMCESERWT